MVKYWIGERCAGKTYRMLHECNSVNGILVVRNRCRRVYENYCNEFKLNNITVMEYQEAIVNRCNQPYFIDEIDDFIKYILERGGSSVSNFSGFTLDPQMENSLEWKSFKPIVTNCENKWNTPE